MSKPKLVYIHATYGYYIAFTHLREAIAKIADVDFHECPVMEENMSPMFDAEQLTRDFNADAIIIDVNNTVHRSVSNMDKVKCLKVMFSDDPHNWLHRQVVFMNKAKIDIMLMMNYGNWHGRPEDYPVWWREPFTLASERPKEIYGGIMSIADKYQRQLTYPCKYFFFPESVNVNFFKDQGYERNIDVFNSGSFSQSVYPLRCYIYQVIHTQPEIECGIVPSFAYSWEQYAEKIARSKMLVEGVGIFGYTSQRFTQAMASKTLVVSSLPFDNEENGFIPDYNFIEITKDNFLEKVLYYKEHEDERRQLIENAYQTIMRHHTVELRAQELVDIVKGNFQQ